MWLPTQAQVNTAGRYATAVAGTAITIFGLQAKGFTLDQAKDVIAALGTTVNSVVILLGALASAYAAIKGIKSSGQSGQGAQIGANASTLVQPGPNGTAIVTMTDPDMAKSALTAQKNTA